MNKLFISPAELQIDAVLLGKAVMRDGWQPTHMAALWRGGAPLGIQVHEILEQKYGTRSVKHIPVLTSRYTAPGEAKATVDVHGLEYLFDRLTQTSRLLILDDVYESGRSVDAVIKELEKKLVPLERMPLDVRVAVDYYKPTRNETDRIPHYYVHTTDRWIVFPHETHGLTREEIAENRGEAMAALVFN